jgi:hypothetical protein
MARLSYGRLIVSISTDPGRVVTVALYHGFTGSWPAIPWVLAVFLTILDFVPSRDPLPGWVQPRSEALSSPAGTAPQCTRWSQG